MTAKFQLRYFFDWKCDPLWSANDAAREAFGYAVEPAELPLSDPVSYTHLTLPTIYSV